MHRVHVIVSTVAIIIIVIAATIYLPSSLSPSIPLSFSLFAQKWHHSYSLHRFHLRWTTRRQMSDKSPTSTRRLSSIFAPLTLLNEADRLLDFRFDSLESSSSPSKYRNSYGYGERSGSSGAASASVTPKDMTLRSMHSTTSSSSNQSTHSDQFANGGGTQLASIRKISMGFSSMPNSPRLMPKQIAHTANGSAGFGGALSTLTDHLNVQQVNKYNQGGFPEINWQERCLELQLELHRSKSQSERIRGMLRDKVSTFILF